jgi:hypothetical protein
MSFGTSKLTTWLTRSTSRPARRDVGGDDDVERTVLEPLDRALASRLRHLTESGALAKPRASSFSATSVVAVRVRTKISIASNSSASRIRVSASSLSK